MVEGKGLVLCGVLLVSGADGLVGEELVVESPEQVVTCIWTRVPALRLKTASGVVAFMSAETCVTLIVTGAWATSLQIRGLQMRQP